MKSSHVLSRWLLASASLAGTFAARGQSTWAGATNGEWATPGNWAGVAPNASGAVANINNAHTVNLTGGPFTFGTLATNIASGSAVIGNNGITTDILTAATASGSPVINVANAGGAMFFYANLEGSQGFEKTGAGRLTFRFNGADQNYTGDIRISAGTLGIEKNGSLGNANNDLFIANNAKLIAEPGSNSGTITLAATRTITLTGAQSQIGAGNAAVNLVIDGTVTEDAAGKGLVKTDAGKVTLNGSIGYTGETRIAAGTLALGGTAALPTGQNLRFTGGAVSTLDLGGTSQTVRTILMDVTTHNRVFTGGGSLTVDGDTNLQLSANNGVSYDFSGINNFAFNRATREFKVQTVNVAGITAVADVNLAKSGASGGVNTLTSSNILVGGANSDGNNGSTARLHLGTRNTFNAPVFQIGAFNAAGVVDFQSGLGSDPFLRLRGADGSGAMTTWKIGESSAGARNGQGTVNLTGGRLDAVVTNLSIGRHIAGSNLADTSSLTFAAGSLEAGTIVLAEKTGSGTPTITSTLTQGGGTVIAGTLTFGNGGGSQAAQLLPTYNLNGGTLHATTLTAGGGVFAANSSRNLNIGTATLRNLAGSNLAVAGFDTTASGRLNVNLGGAAIFHADIGRTITVANTAPIGGSGSLEKAGDGTLIFQGSHTYSGATLVSAGSLYVNGDLANSAITVTAGTLGGSSSNLGGGITVGLAGTLAPGNSIGSMTTSSAVIAGTLAVEFGSSSIDLLSVTGLLDITGGNVSFIEFAGPLDGTSPYVFASYGSLSGIFSGIAPSGYTIDYAFDDGVSTRNIALVAVPEPRAAMLGLVGMLLLVRRRVRSGEA